MRSGQGKAVVSCTACALLMTNACRAVAPPAPRSSDASRAARPNDASSTPCARERSQAGALEQAAEALGPPDVPPFGSKTASLTFIQGPVAHWVRSRRAATEQADQALAAAVTCTPNAQQSNLLLRRGRLQSHFLTAFLRVGDAALPAQFTADPELKRAMARSLLDAVQPQLERARSFFEQCTALGGQRSAADVSACAAELAALPGRENPAPSASTSTTKELEPPPRLAFVRPLLPTTQPSPCAFAGTLALWRPVLTIGSREVARMERVELSRLTLPPARSGAFVVETAWPIRGSFALSADALPFNLRSRVDLVGKHVWLSTGAAVSAAAPVAGSALVYRPPGEGANVVTPDPAAKVACSELELASGAEPPTEDTKRDSVSFKGLLKLMLGLAVHQAGQVFSGAFLERSCLRRVTARLAEANCPPRPEALHARRQKAPLCAVLLGVRHPARFMAVLRVAWRHAC